MNASLPRWHVKRLQTKTAPKLVRLARIMSLPPARLPGEPPAPPDNAPPIVWQVFLGCTTPRKLATQLSITTKAAQTRLSRGCRDGWLFHNGGRYQAKCLQRRDAVI